MSEVGADAGDPRAKNVHLYFGSKSELAEISKKDDASTSYVIFQNDRLHSHVERLQRRVKELERERDKAVEDADRAEMSKTCIKGMLHNEIQRSQLLGDVVLNLEARGERLSSFRSAYSASSAAHAAVALLAHLLGLWASGVLARAVFSAHFLHSVAYAWFCFGSPSRGSEEASASEAALLHLRAKLASVERGTEHLHNIVDEM